MRRTLFKILGLFFVGLGMLGAFLPILPTTPFLLLALWFFGKSSPKLKQWLLTNKICGKYINDFYEGRGIPARVKVYTIVLLWTFILLSMWWVDLLWVRVVLIIVAIGVSVHILRFKTKRMYKKVVVVIPTKSEMAQFPEELPFGVSLVEGGVGMAEIAVSTARELHSNPKPDLIILAGIAGAYPDSGLLAGESVLVGKEYVADLGAYRDNAFMPLYTKYYECPMVEKLTTLKRVNSCTVNCGSVPFLNLAEGESSCSIENMEGAAFFALCLEAGVDFVQVRSISNLTTDKRSDWEIDRAVKSLAVAVLGVIKELRSL